MGSGRLWSGRGRKTWGTATRRKSNTTIVHSPSDEVIPYADSEQLRINSELPIESLTAIGDDHRLADPEPLAKMLDAIVG